MTENTKQGGGGLLIKKQSQKQHPNSIEASLSQVPVRKLIQGQLAFFIYICINDNLSGSPLD